MAKEKLSARDWLAVWLVREDHSHGYLAHILGVRPEYVSRWMHGLAPTVEQREALYQETDGFVPATGRWV